MTLWKTIYNWKCMNVELIRKAKVFETSWLFSIFPSLTCQICQKLFIQKQARNMIKKTNLGSVIKFIYWIQKVCRKCNSRKFSEERYSRILGTMRQIVFNNKIKLLISLKTNINLLCFQHHVSLLDPNRILHLHVLTWLLLFSFFIPSLYEFPVL